MRPLLGAFLAFVFLEGLPGESPLLAAPPPAPSPSPSSSSASSLNDLVREGLRFDFGAKGSPRDPARAVALYRKAAARGSLPAMMLLSQRYEIGRGVPQDDSRALFWLRKAAHGGYPPAEDALGDRYAGGVGVKKNDARAVFWYLRAGRHGYGESQDLLGLRYERGEGVPRDLSRARLWYERAARDAGNPDAFSRLGVLWETGKGGPRSLERAYFWEALAKTTNPAAQVRYEALSRKLAPEVRRRLDREVAEFLKKYQPRWTRFVLRP
ncbi:MAG: tetratricopeptide repeat protein [Leptospirillia bacterium]